MSDKDEAQEQEAILRGAVVEDHISSELATELEIALASSTYLKSVSLKTATDEEIERGSIESIFGLPSPFWAEIIVTLTFVSTSIAASVLNKMGEDIYDQLKKRFTKTIEKKEKKKDEERNEIETSIIIHIKINVDELEIVGVIDADSIDVGSKEAVAEAFRNAPQMLITASKTSEGRKRRKSKNSFIQRYRYDVTKKAWLRIRHLKSIPPDF